MKKKVIFPIEVTVMVPVSAKLLVEFTGTEEEIKKQYDKFTYGDKIKLPPNSKKISLKYDDQESDIARVVNESGLPELRHPNISEDVEVIIKEGKEVE